MRRQGQFADLPQAPEDVNVRLGDLPEDINWREVRQVFYKIAELQPKKPIDELLLDMLEIGFLAPQAIPPLRNKPFKEDVRKFAIPGITPTGTTGEETGTTTGTRRTETIPPDTGEPTEETETIPPYTQETGTIIETGVPTGTVPTDTGIPTGTGIIPQGQ